MFDLTRRRFLGSSAAASFAAGLAFHVPELAAKDSEKVVVKKPVIAPLPEPVFLTWWTDPTTTMVIQWVGLPHPDKLVQFSQLDDKLWQVAKVITKPFPDTDLVVYRCELSGLQPGTEYRFQLGSESKARRFRTMPAKSTNTIQFVSGGDCGTGSHAITSNKLAAQQEPYFALIGGDLAYDNGNSPATFLKFLRNYSEHMIDPKGRMIPLITCPGNHEVNGSKQKRENAPHYLSVFDGILRDTSYSVLDFGDYMSIVLLDTGHLSPIKGAQTSWLETTLADRQDRQHLIVANHVPAYPSYRPAFNKDGAPSTGGDNRKYWCPLFEKYNVDLVLEHHDHTFKRTHLLKDGLRDNNGVLYLGDGSWGQLRSIQKPEDRPYLAAWSEAYHVTVHRMEGDQRFHVALAESGKVADVCTTTSKRAARRG